MRINIILVVIANTVTTKINGNKIAIRIPKAYRFYFDINEISCLGIY